jgi:hypothetical protein
MEWRLFRHCSSLSSAVCLIYKANPHFKEPYTLTLLSMKHIFSHDHYMAMGLNK